MSKIRLSENLHVWVQTHFLILEWNDGRISLWLRIAKGKIRKMRRKKEMSWYFDGNEIRITRDAIRIHSVISGDMDFQISLKEGEMDTLIELAKEAPWSA